MQLRIANSIIIVLLFCVSLAYSQISTNPQSTNRPLIIAGVTVEGNRIVDESTIIVISGIRVGDELNPRSDFIQQAIKNIWQRKQFSDIQILVDKITSLGVFLRIVVKENPRFSYLQVEGNDKIGYEKLKTEIGKIRGDIIAFSDTYDIKNTLKKLYEKEGLLFAKIKVDTVTTDTAGYVKLLVTIKEGDEYKVRTVSFTGNKLVDATDLTGAMEDNKPKPWWKIWKTSKFDKNTLHTTDVPAILKYYKSNGFLDADTTKVTYTIDTTANAVDILIDVIEGNKYYLRNITFDGSTIYPNEFLVRHLDVEKGKAVDEIRIEKNLMGNEEQSDIRSLYLDNGYLQANISYDLRKVAKDSVDLVAQIFERDRFTIRRVDIVGNSKTQDRVVRRELYTRPGDFFNRAAIIRSIKGLGVANYFNPEKLRPDVKPVGQNTVDLVYQVEERSTDVLNASVGYAGTYGLTGSVGVTFNNFDISDPLRGGAGQVFSFQYDFGAANSLQTFSLSFSEPWLFGKPTSVGFNVFDTRYFLGINGRRTGLQTNLGRRLRFPDDYFRADWSFLGQHTIQYSNTAAGDSSFYEFALTQTISRTSFDNLIFPSSGSRFRWQSSASLGFLGIGQADYWKNELQFEFVNPLLEVEGFNRLVMYLNTELGYVARLTTDNSHVLPSLQLYAMGGNGLAGINVIPLRGYPDRVLGGYGNTNRLIFKQTAELRFALSMNPMPIYLSAWAEAGNAWTNFREADIFSLKRSAGIGMRILLNPIGLLGFDYGYGFDTDPSTKLTSGWQFHFQFGR
ncbi:MAG: outer membrane protein assembly factor BamA [Candidatus Kapabacteria bacterium]|nr:outer membrane protein assembly factor BamA [Candidatus Kapabacteria bacterium]